MLVAIIRHGKAEERDAGRWPDDGARPLTEAGIAELERMGPVLPRLGVVFNQLYSSPLVRADQTAQLLANAPGQSGAYLRTDLLGSGFEIGAVCAFLNQQATNGPIGLVGHEPDLGWLGSFLLGAAPGAIQLKKGAMLLLEVDEAERGSGELRGYWTPKQLLGAAG